ncbi:glycyl-radical enzyme activating protein [Anaerofustis stercorihominis]|uniref:glycyl-radical enzyme activating protein n=1 Tax=Anaerofustis stercorihominis TaxID=214853 RepID=UPI00214B0704|nr:glycyl-radical enzyme activating protein [Anaerofustis stercorihominis]MCR2033342.1 glycyl-radical enzyme activating protein [Anaerofustis stercorihominis]
MGEKSAVIFDIQKYSIHDGPGIRTVVFLKGCPLRCPWCANPESQLLEPKIVYFKDKCIGDLNCKKVCPKGAITVDKEGININEDKCTKCMLCVDNCYATALRVYGKNLSIDEIITKCMEDKIFYETSKGGVTLSGGEPLFQFEAAYEILKRLKSRDINTAIETTGYVSKENINKIMKYVDLFLFDIKAVDNDKHKRLTGVDNNKIHDNLRYLDEHNKNIIIRVPVIPSLNDSKEDMLYIIKLIKSLKNKYEVNLLPYHRLGLYKYEVLKKEYELKDITPPKDDQMNSILKMFEENGLECQIGG